MCETKQRISFRRRWGSVNVIKWTTRDGGRWPWTQQNAIKVISTNKRNEGKDILQELYFNTQRLSMLMFPYTLYIIYNWSNMLRFFKKTHHMFKLRSAKLNLKQTERWFIINFRNYRLSRNNFTLLAWFFLEYFPLF